jgi:hypothetical protein
MQFRDDLIGRYARGTESSKFRPGTVAEVVAVLIGDTGRPELLLAYADGVMEFFDYKQCILEPRK